MLTGIGNTDPGRERTRIGEILRFRLLFMARSS